MIEQYVNEFFVNLFTNLMTIEWYISFFKFGIIINFCMMFFIFCVSLQYMYNISKKDEERIKNFINTRNEFIKKTKSPIHRIIYTLSYIIPFFHIFEDILFVITLIKTNDIPSSFISKDKYSIINLVKYEFKKEEG